VYIILARKVSGLVFCLFVPRNAMSKQCVSIGPAYHRNRRHEKQRHIDALNEMFVAHGKLKRPRNQLETLNVAVDELLRLGDYGPGVEIKPAEPELPETFETEFCGVVVTVRRKPKSPYKRFTKNRHAEACREDLKDAMIDRMYARMDAERADDSFAARRARQEVDDADPVVAITRDPELFEVCARADYEARLMQRARDKSRLRRDRIRVREKDLRSLVPGPDEKDSSLQLLRRVVAHLRELYGRK
jgi:hypothetical protein